MSNVLKLGKKVLTVSTVFTTMLWSVGVASLVPAVAQAASCPSFGSGDMVKVTGKPAIYSVDSNGKVLYFPSGDEFKSWNQDEKYSGYTTISQECYDALPIPTNAPYGVGFRAGSFVVKRASSDQLYVVEPGNKLAKITPEAANALYGTGHKTFTVADVFWPNYGNTRGADVTEAKVHPGMLVKNGGKNYLVNADGKLQEVSSAGFTANRFKTAFVRVATDAMISGLSFGDKIDVLVASLSDRSQTGGTTTTAVVPATTVTGGSLTVSLASDNPFAATIVSDSGTNGAQAMIPVLKLNLTAGSGDAKISTIKLTRSGISADTDISNMYLYDGDTKVSSNPSVSNNGVTFTISGGLTVPSGSSKTLLAKLDLKNAVSSGKTYVFSVNAGTDIVLSGGGTVGGSFPVSSNIFTSAAVTDIGKLVFTNVSPTAAGTVDPGTTGFEIWRFTAASTNQDMQVRKMVFTMVGSINVGDLQNFSLWDGATQIGSTVVDMNASKIVTLDLSAAPYLVTKGQTKTLSLKADIVAGTNRTFYASFQNSGDIVSFDKNYGVFVKTNGTDTFTVLSPVTGTTAVSYTINTGSLTQTLSADSPTGNIAKGATNVTLAKFLWKANGEDIKVSSLNVSSTSSGNSLSNVRLLVNGSQVGSTIATLTANGASNNGWGTFGNSFIIGAGKSAVVTIVADTTHSSVAADETVIAGFPAGSSNAQGNVSLTSISSVAQNANTLTFKAGTVTVSKNAAFGDKTSTNPTGPVNATQVKVGSMVIVAGAGEDVSLTQIVIEDFNTAAANCAGTSLQNLTLKDASGKQLGTTYANPASTCATRNAYTFNVSPSVTIKNGAQYVVDVFADLKAAYTTASTALLDVKTITASGITTGTDASVTPTAQTVPLQYTYISSAGSLMIQVDSDTPVANNYLMGATDQVIGKFKLSASSTEAVNITQLVLSSKFSSAATGTVKNIRLVDDLTGAPIGSAVSSFNDSVAGTTYATSTYSHATFTGLNLQVASGVSKTIDVKADFTSYVDTGLSTTGQTIAPVVLATYGGTTGSTNPITATGVSSGSSITATVSNYGSINNFGDFTGGGFNGGAYSATATLYRAKLTTAWATDAPSGAASPGVSQNVAKFVITNLANGGAYTATVNLINFNLSTTISATAGVNSTRALTVYKDSLSTTALATTNFAAAEKLDGTGPSGAVADTATRISSGANFTAVDIASGASKTFYVTLDTSDAASTKSLSIRIPASNITWTDGVSTTLTVMGSDLPLQYKTFTY